MANVSNATGVFTGISALYVAAAGATTFAASNEVPCAEDGGFSYNGGAPSTERFRIHGLTTPWAAKMTPGDTEVSLFIPQVTDAILTLFGFTTGSAVSGTVNGSTFSGTGFTETAKEVNLAVAAVSADETQLFYIKKVKLLASIVFDQANSAKPVGIQLSGTSLAGADTDAMAICTVTAPSNPG